MVTVSLALLLAAGPADAGAPPSMRVLFDSLVGLEPYLAQPAALKDAKNAEAVAARLEALSKLKHVFPADPKAQEPATAALSTLFSQYAADTRRRFDEGDRETVAMRVRTLVSLCVTCHARERAAADFDDVRRAVDSLSLSPFERAQYLAATRQFDAAVAAYRALLAAQPKSERELLEYSRALRDALALEVRVKDDAKAAAALLDEVEKRKELPPFLLRSVGAWKRDVAAWQKEKFDASKATPEALFKKAQALLEKADGKRTLLADDSTDVVYLRASGYLNLALALNPKLAARGEALYLLGLCAAALKSPLLWDVDLLYFEACVRENPRTRLAQKCFQQLSERVYFGFTGSAGTNIPEDEAERLAALRKLAE